jgi:hypothetical protein
MIPPYIPLETCVQALPVLVIGLATLMTVGEGVGSAIEVAVAVGAVVWVVVGTDGGVTVCVGGGIGGVGNPLGVGITLATASFT